MFVAKSRELDSLAAGYAREDDELGDGDVDMLGGGSEFEDIAKVRSTINPNADILKRHMA